MKKVNHLLLLIILVIGVSSCVEENVQPLQEVSPELVPENVKSEVDTLPKYPTYPAYPPSPIR